MLLLLIQEILYSNSTIAGITSSLSNHMMLERE